MTPRRIFLIGISGCGKSTVGELLAKRLGWTFADSDREVERAAGRSIPEIFRTDGEAKFRELEAAAIEELAGAEPIVIATGGGAPTHEPSRRAITNGFVVWLSVSPAKAAERLRANPETETRPLLEGDVEGRLTALLAARAQYYQRADASIDVDSFAPEQVVEEIARLWAEWLRHPPADRLAAAEAVASGFDIAATVRTPTAAYPVVVQEGLLGQLGALCRYLGLGGRAFVVTDTNTGPLLGEAAGRALEASGYRTFAHAIPAGEEQKTLATVERVYDWLLGQRVERSDFVICLGGGVVTDLAGFAAATCLRGIDFVHVPTSLLSMVDASIGGKTGVDHARGKNMIGAFAQPRAVAIDPLVLRSLPERQLRNGWAEVIKHGFILDEHLVTELEAVAGDPAALMSPSLIARSTAIKAEIVSEDEREAGRRTLLNYGHTVGHAIEAATGYTEYLHGEAVAIGMRAAGLIAQEIGMLSSADFARQQKLIRAAGLPERAPRVSVETVLQAMLSDKKVRAGEVRWVLLESIGRAVSRKGVPPDAIRRAVEAVLS